MERDQIKEVLLDVFGPNTELVDHPKWVGLRCPLAPWTHEKGADKLPSSGVSIKPDDISIFNCLACGTKGPLSRLIEKYDEKSGEDHSALVEELEDGEYLGGNVPQWGSREKANAKEKYRVLGKEYLDLYDPAVGHPYLAERGISDEAAEVMQLKVDDADSTGHERILFPVFTDQNELVGFTGRAVKERVDPRVRDYHGLQKRQCLLGIHLIKQEDPYIVIVEGLFDYAYMVQNDYPAVATMFAGLTSQQKAILISIGKPVILMYDNDLAGQDATDGAIKALRKYLPLRKVSYPSRARAGSRRRDPPPKDPATCTPEELDTMISTAKIV